MPKVRKPFSSRTRVEAPAPAPAPATAAELVAGKHAVAHKVWVESREAVHRGFKQRDNKEPK